MRIKPLGDFYHEEDLRKADRRPEGQAFGGHRKRSGIDTDSAVVRDRPDRAELAAQGLERFVVSRTLSSSVFCSDAGLDEKGAATGGFRHEEDLREADLRPQGQALGDHGGKRRFRPGRAQRPGMILRISF